MLDPAWRMTRIPGAVGALLLCLPLSACLFKNSELPDDGSAPAIEFTSMEPDAVLYPVQAEWAYSARVSDADTTDPTRLKIHFELLRDKTTISETQAIPKSDGSLVLKSIPLEEGDYRLKLEATDESGNVGIRQQGFRVYNQPPRVEIESLFDGGVVDQGNPLQLQARIVDPDNPPERGFQAMLEVASGGVSWTQENTLTAEDGAVVFEYTPEQTGSLVLTVVGPDELGAVGETSLFLEVEACNDADGDGFWTCVREDQPADCDDQLPQVSPGASELCDGLDDDCDGQVPENELDADGDAQTPCAGDCDDTDPSFFGGALELCDGLDNDCDGLVPSVELDLDSDGIPACSLGDLPGDCNDADPLIFPGAEERCDNADSDCDGAKGEDELDTDGDLHPLCQGDCDDLNPFTYPGAFERLDLRDNDCDGAAEGPLSVASAYGSYAGVQVDSYLGLSMSAGGDLDGDGLDDLAIGAPRYNAPGSTLSLRGGVFLVLGRSTGWGVDGEQALASGLILSEGEGSAFAGTSVSIPGDLNGDGIDDLVVGAPGHSTSSFDDAGGVYVIPGRELWNSDALLDVAISQVEGSASDMQLGQSLSLGADLNADGVLDVAMGAPWTSRRPSPTGMVALLSARSVGWSTKTSVTSLARITGTEDNAIGTALSVGYTSGDATAELLVGGLADPAVESGLVYWIQGSSSVRAPQQTQVTSLTARAYTGDDADERVGYSVSGGVDVDGDGLDDALFGRASAGSAGDALVYLVFGAASLPAGGDAEVVAGIRFLGSSNDLCPCTVTGLDDWNGDGLEDFAIGVSRATYAGKDSGAVYLFLGRAGRAAWPEEVALSEADGILYGEAGGDQAGAGLTSGDLDGDGRSDLIIAAPAALVNTGTSSSKYGRVYVVLGPRASSSP